MDTNNKDAQPSDQNSPLNLDVVVGHANFSASGESGNVLDAFAQFQALLKESTSNVTQSVGGDTGSPEVSEETTAAKTAPEADAEQVERIPLPVFLDQKQLPRGNAVIALAIAVWAKRFDGTNEIDSDTAKSYWRNSGKKIPANITRDLGSAASEGWLERLAAGRGMFSVTSFGEKYFDALPVSE